MELDVARIGRLINSIAPVEYDLASSDSESDVEDLPLAQRRRTNDDLITNIPEEFWDAVPKPSAANWKEALPQGVLNLSVDLVARLKEAEAEGTEDTETEKIKNELGSLDSACIACCTFRRALAYPCGHLAYCMVCVSNPALANYIFNCPQCRAPLRKNQKLIRVLA
jgi:hypothetical protein